MSVEVSITDGPLPAASQSNTPVAGKDDSVTQTSEAPSKQRPKRQRGLPSPSTRETSSTIQTGAVLVFEGIVRSEEDGQRINALIYTAYEPMATMELTKLAQDVCTRHSLARITVEHSRGRVRVGEVSFRLTIRSPHRKQALAAMDEFIDRMKRDVPIWKKVAGE